MIISLAQALIEGPEPKCHAPETHGQHFKEVDPDSGVLVEEEIETVPEETPIPE